MVASFCRFFLFLRSIFNSMLFRNSLAQVRWSFLCVKCTKRNCVKCKFDLHSMWGKEKRHHKLVSCEKVHKILIYAISSPALNGGVMFKKITLFLFWIYNVLDFIFLMTIRVCAPNFSAFYWFTLYGHDTFFIESEQRSIKKAIWTRQNTLVHKNAFEFVIPSIL